MAKEKFKIKAAKEAPEVVVMGNLIAENKDGYFETSHERFAEFLRENYGTKAAAAEKAKEEDK